MRRSIMAALLLGGCSELSMKPPAASAGGSVLPVREHIRFGAGAPDTITIGTAEVREIVTPPIFAPGTVPYGRAADPDRRSYRFTVHERERSLQGECSEQARDPQYFGLGEAAVDLQCRCLDGARQVASLTLRDGQGEASLANHAPFLVWQAYESAQGSPSRSPLGYRFRDAHGEAGLDATRTPQAYMPANLDPAQSLSLTCLYAGLLLHRPSK